MTAIAVRRSDRDAHLAAIQAAPDDDAPRLIYADWLDEHGEEARASFIRVQVELAQVCSRRPGHNAGTATAMRDPMTVWRETVDALRSRESDLLYKLAANGLDDLPPGWTVNCGNGKRLGDIRAEASYDVQFARGFIATVRGQLATLIGDECERCRGTGSVPHYQGMYRLGSDPCPACRGKKRASGIIGDLFRREPAIQRVEFSDREPWSPNEQTPWRQWYRGNGSGAHPQSDLPEEVFDLLEGGELMHGTPRKRRVYPSPAAAIDALSDAACAVGRKRAKTILEGASRE